MIKPVFYVLKFILLFSAASFFMITIFWMQDFYKNLYITALMASGSLYLFDCLVIKVLGGELPK